jgi:DNA-binding IclR family transcriptional regulator
LRGRLLVALAEQGGLSADELAGVVRFEPERVALALAALQSEGFVVSEDDRWRIG